MSPLGIVLQFLSVFAAAFLAFVLENFRERRRTARWVREHLGHMREALDADAPTTRAAREALGRMARSLDSWLSAQGPEDMSDGDWQRAGEGVRTFVPDLGPVLRSEAVTVLPQDLALALAKLEENGVLFSHQVASFQEAHRDMLPVWHDRRVPLEGGDASRVRRARSALDELSDALPQIVAATEAVLAALARWR